MSTVIYYFTGTGNSLKIAKDIAEKLGDATLIPVAQAVTRASIDPGADAVGIVFPVYMWGMPLIMSDFVKKLAVKNNAYIFGVTNYGGNKAGALIQLDRELKAKGLKLSSSFGIKMPGNYTPMYGAIAMDKQQKFFTREQEITSEIAETVKTRKPNKIASDNFLVNAILSSVIYPNGSKQIPGSDKKFFADEKCNSCGICAQVCPVANIKMVEGKPQWLHHCQQCLACLQWCPQVAIQFGPKTAMRKRYQHPDIKVNDMINSRQPK
jgi:ferredoxin